MGRGCRSLKEVEADAKPNEQLLEQLVEEELERRANRMAAFIGSGALNSNNKNPFLKKRIP